MEELDELTSLAKKNGLFFMEAVWTRFQPIAQAVRDIIASGRLGRPKRFTADFSMDQDLSREFFDCIYRSKLGGAYGLGCGSGLIEERDPEHWSLKPEQGGGSLLDM